MIPLLLLGLVAGCREPAPHKAEAPPKTKAAALRPVEPVKEAPAARVFRWPDGERALFEVSLSGTLSMAGESVIQRIGVSSAMEALVVEKKSKEDLVLVRLIGPEVSIDGESGPTQEQLQVLRLELSQPVWGRYRSGKLTKLYLPQKPSAYAAGVWRTALFAMQISTPLDGGEAHETSEFDNNGEYTVSYRRIADGTWSKTKRSYLRGLHAPETETPFGAVPAPRLVSSEGEVKIEGNQLKKVSLSDTIEVPLGGSSGLTGEARFALSLKESAATVPEARRMPPADALVLAADEPFVQELPPDAMDQARMKGLTFEKTLRALVARSRDPRKKALWAKKNEQEAATKDKKAAEAWTEDWARYFAALPAFFRQKPETLAAAEKEIREGNPATASLLGGLSSSGNSAAQEVLVRLVLDDQLEQSLRESAMRNLVQCRLPTKKSAEVVWQLSSGSMFSRVAVFGIGIMARKLRKNGETELAEKILHDLLARLTEVEDPHEKRDVLRGISNTGDPAALPAVKPLLESDTPAIRGGVVEAVRLMELPEADQLIAERISHVTEPASGVRVSAIRAAATRSHEDPVLAALLSAATEDPDKKVKKEARKLLFSWSNDMPELRTTLEQIADRDEEEGG